MLKIIFHHMTMKITCQFSFGGRISVPIAQYCFWSQLPFCMICYELIVLSVFVTIIVELSKFEMEGDISNLLSSCLSQVWWQSHNVQSFWSRNLMSFFGWRVICSRSVLPYISCMLWEDISRTVTKSFNFSFVWSWITVSISLFFYEHWLLLVR